MSAVLELAGYAIYTAMAFSALLGLFFTILIAVRITQKRFPDTIATPFLEEVHDLLQKKDFDGITQLCDTPGYWSKAVPQLMMIAVEKRNLPIAKVRRIVGERFERDILADFEYQSSWISTVVKSAPMLGLLGTVVGMIEAFAKIAAASETGAGAGALAEDISFALSTTAMGLSIAIPLVVAANIINVRIGKLQDSVQDQLGEFIDDLAITNAREKGGV